jgi:two-component system, sensor histidine kinase
MAGGLRVVVCEDVDDIRELFADVLRLHGHDVTVVACGSAAIAAARAGPVDVALIDIALPDMTGYEVARILRADPHTHRLRLVAVTGLARAKDRRAALDAGFDVHLPKPITVHALLAALRA